MIDLAHSPIDKVTVFPKGRLGRLRSNVVFSNHYERAQVSIACELLECGEEEEDNHCLFSGSHLVILLPATFDQHGRQGGRHQQGGRDQQGGRHLVWSRQLDCEILFLRHEIEKGLRAVYNRLLGWLTNHLAADFFQVRSIHHTYSLHNTNFLKGKQLKGVYQKCFTIA